MSPSVLDWWGWWRVACPALFALWCLTPLASAQSSSPSRLQSGAQSRAQSSAHSRIAPSLPTAVLLATSGGHRSARALDSVIGAALDELNVVDVVARPGLDLGAVQLALDCVAETPQCLRQVTSQHEAQVLVAPSLAHTANELVLTLLRFDTRSGQTQRVLHRQPGQALTSATLDAVPGLLRELFELPPEEQEPAVAEPSAPDGATETETPATSSYEALRDVEALPEPPMEAPGDGRGAPLGPLLLGGGGVVLLGAGLVMGLTVLSANDDYDSWTSGLLDATHDEAVGSVDAALGRKDTGETNAVLANIFMGVGSAVVVASGIWLAVELTQGSSRYDDHVQLTPLVGRHELGLQLTHRGAGL